MFRRRTPHDLGCWPAGGGAAQPTACICPVLASALVMILVKLVTQIAGNKKAPELVLEASGLWDGMVAERRGPEWGHPPHDDRPSPL